MGTKLKYFWKTRETVKYAKIFSQKHVAEAGPDDLRQMFSIPNHFVTVEGAYQTNYCSTPQSLTTWLSQN